MTDASVSLLVLDSHAWFWLITDPGRLSGRAQEAMVGADRLAISAFTIWELALKNALGKLRLDREFRAWLDIALAESGVEVLAFDGEIAVRAVELRNTVGPDPADTAIVATALTYRASLVTKDGRITRSRVVATIW